MTEEDMSEEFRLKKKNKKKTHILSATIFFQ